MADPIRISDAASELTAAAAERPLHVLLLCNYYPGTASTILEHIHAFPRFSRNRYHVLNNLGDLPWWLDLSRFDALIIHYSLVASYDNYLSPSARARIREFTGYKAAFVQDDYRWINDTVDALAYMRVNAVFGLPGQDIIAQVYSPARLPGVRLETVLTGYVAEDLTRIKVPPLAERPIDVGYRARKLPAWIGSHTLQKWQIADRFRADAPGYGLKVDISYAESDRIYGDEWIRFVANCKAMLGTESGASVCDFTGDIQRNVEAHLKRDPEASFDTLRDLYFKDVDGKIMMNVISPRCFEAAALRTLMIFYEGHYSGILEPWRHYVPLLPDHSNMADVVRILRHPTEAQAIVDRAYQEIALNSKYTFRALVRRVDEVMATDYGPAGRRDGYSPEEYAWRMSRNSNDLTRYATPVSPRESTGAAVMSLLHKPSEQPRLLRTPATAPYTIEMTLSPELRLSAVHLVWASPEACATGGQVEALCKRRVVRRVRFRSPTPGRYARIAIPPRARADRLRLCFDGFFAGDAVRLQDIRLDGEVHWAERTRQLREHARAMIGTRLRWRLSEIWMSLPEAVRLRLRRPVRAIHDKIVGKRD